MKEVELPRQQVIRTCRPWVAGLARVTCASCPWDNRASPSHLPMLFLYSNVPFPSCKLHGCHSANVCSPQMTASLIVLSRSSGMCMNYGTDAWRSPGGQVDGQNLQEMQGSSYFSPATSLPHCLSCPSHAACINRNIVSRPRVMIFHLYLELTQSLFVLSDPFWTLRCIGNIN